jgi:hypothetical protein
MSDVTEIAEPEEFKPVASIVRREFIRSKPIPSPKRLTRASHANFRRVLQILRSLGKYPR